MSEPTPVSEQHCANCRYYIRRRAECHRNAPTTFPARRWPGTLDEEWCGEWQAGEQHK